MCLLYYKEKPRFLMELIWGAGVLEGFVVCLQRGRGLGEERFKLREELLASAGSFPRRIVVSPWSRRKMPRPWRLQNQLFLPHNHTPSAIL